MATKDENTDNYLQNDPNDINDEYAMKKKQKLPQDYETPFSDPQYTDEPISKDAQQADAKLDSHEVYDEGFSSATEKKVDSINNKSDKEDFDEDMHIEYDEIK